MFKNRADAAEKLFEKLKEHAEKKDVQILGLFKGGAVMARRLSSMLGVKEDMIFTEKLIAPQNPELAIGAVAEDEIILDRSLIGQLGISEEYLEKKIQQAGKKILKEQKEFRKSRPLHLKNKTVILVSEGMATGSTMMASLEFTLKQKPKKVIIALPVSTKEALAKFNHVADIVCLKEVEEMMSVSEFYQDFSEDSI